VAGWQSSRAGKSRIPFIKPGRERNIFLCQQYFLGPHVISTHSVSVNINVNKGSNINQIHPAEIIFDAGLAFPFF